MIDLRTMVKMIKSEMMGGAKGELELTHFELHELVVRPWRPGVHFHTVPQANHQKLDSFVLH